MKKLVFIIIAALLLSSCRTSRSQFYTFYKNHKEEAAVSLKVPSFMARLMVNREDDLKPFKDVLRKTKNYRLIVFPETSNTIQKDFSRFIKRNQYETILRVKENQEAVTFYTKKLDNNSSEIILHVNGDSNVMIGFETKASIDSIMQKVAEIE